MIRCPNCNTVNLDFQLSCSNCKVKLWHTCSACGAVVPLGAKFCGSCGRVQPERPPSVIENITLENPQIIPLTGYKSPPDVLEKFPPLFSKALNGEGQAVFVYGDAGIGKSSLIEQVLAFAASNKFQVFHLKAKPLTRTIVLAPMLEFVAQICNIQPGDDKNTVLAKIMTLSSLGLMEEEIAIVGEYLGVDMKRQYSGEWTSEDLHTSAAFYTMVKIIRNVALKHPIAIAIDNIQWLDPISKKFLSPLIEVISGMRAVLIVGSREAGVDLGDHKGLLHIEVPPLGAKDVLTLVADSLMVNALPKEVAQEVLMISEGNPTIALELTRFMRDSGIIELDVNGVKIVKRRSKLPTTIEEIVRARLELLSSKQRELLMLITLLGDDATTERLMPLYRYKESFDADIQSLESKQFIQLGGNVANRIFRIPNSAVLYILDYLIPLEVRQNVQPTIARVLIEKGCRTNWMKDRIITFHMGLLPPNAFEAHYALERLAMQMFDQHQSGLSLIALQSVSQILKQKLQNLPKENADRTVIEQKLAYTLFNLGKAYLEQGKIERVIKTWELALQLARKVKFHYLALDVIGEEITILQKMKRFDEAHKFADIAVQISKGIKFAPGVARGLYLKGKLYESEAKDDLALGSFIESLKVSEEINIPISRKDAYHHRASLGIAEILLRQKAPLEKVAFYLVKALNYCFEYKHLATMERILEKFGQYFQLKGDIYKAIKYTDLALSIARARLAYKDMARLSYTLGNYYVLKQDISNAEIYFAEGLSLALQCDWPEGVELAKRAIGRLQTNGHSTSSWTIPDDIS